MAFERTCRDWCALARNTSLDMLAKVGASRRQEGIRVIMQMPTDLILKRMASIISRLSDTDEEVRRAAMSASNNLVAAQGETGVRAARLLVDHIHACTSTDSGAAHALIVLGCSGPIHVVQKRTEIISCVDDARFIVRHAAVNLLPHCQMPGNEIVNLLRPRLRDESKPVRIVALKTLSSIDGGSASLVDEIAELLGDPAPEVVCNAVNALPKKRVGRCPASPNASHAPAFSD